MKEYAFKYCGLSITLSILAGKWKPMILFHLFHSTEMRFTDLWRIIPKVSKKVLLDHLKQMEDDELIVRHEKHWFPPEVYYQLSDKGRALSTALAQLEQWANEYAKPQVDDMRRQEGKR